MFNELLLRIMILIIGYMACGGCLFEEFVSFLLLTYSFLFAMRAHWTTLIYGAGSVWGVLWHLD